MMGVSHLVLLMILGTAPSMVRSFSVAPAPPLGARGMAVSRAPLGGANLRVQRLPPAVKDEAFGRTSSILRLSAVDTAFASSSPSPSPSSARIARILAASVLAFPLAAVASTGGGIGQKIAAFFRSGGLPDWATLMLISAMPVVELRGGVPVGLWMGLPIGTTLALCIAGNMIPIPLILLALRSKFVQKIAKPVLDRAAKKSESFGGADERALALTLFVGIPLPGTGAWTGAMIASLLRMPVGLAMGSIFAGVVSAGLIMTTLTLAGRTGALAACGVLAVFCLTTIANKNKK
jgi:uncharacterized membrane protein